MDQSLYTSSDLLVQRAQKLSLNQIQAVRVLQYPGQELQAYLTGALSENPALEGEERELCPICHYPVTGGAGERCDCMLGTRQKDERTPDIDAAPEGRDDWDSSLHSPSGASNFDDNDEDPLVRVSGRAEYGAGLLMALRAMIPAADAPIAEYLIGSLNSQGLLPADILDDAAVVLGMTPERVESVLDVLQTLDPPGIGARGIAEALLLQLARLREQGDAHPLAEQLIQHHFDDLAAKHFREIAREIGIAPRLIEIELNFISQKLHPFPAHGFDPDLSGVATGAPPVRPDVVIRRAANGFEADIVEQRRWDLRISDSYREVRQLMKKGQLTASKTERDHIHRSIEDASNLLSALRQRWHTMQRVADALIQMQRDYLENGPSGLKPLTRKDVGDLIGLHESTVSRATDGKFVLLPNGKTVPFDDFFNESLQVKEAIGHLVENEDPHHPYSDEQLTALLRSQGMDVARRTVAKYREEINILPSRLRRNRLAPVSC
jgi:RNA polymerase sigma-54 factor